MNGFLEVECWSWRRLEALRPLCHGSQDQDPRAAVNAEDRGLGWGLRRGGNWSDTGWYRQSSRARPDSDKYMNNNNKE